MRGRPAFGGAGLHVPALVICPVRRGEIRRRRRQDKVHVQRPRLFAGLHGGIRPRQAKKPRQGAEGSAMPAERRRMLVLDRHERRIQPQQKVVLDRQKMGLAEVRRVRGRNRPEKVLRQIRRAAQELLFEENEKPAEDVRRHEVDQANART